MAQPSGQVWSRYGARHAARVALAITGGLVVLGFATVGAALSSAPDARQVQPDSQFPVMAFDVAAVEDAMDPADLAGETVLSKLTPAATLAKADRLAVASHRSPPGVAGAADDTAAPRDFGQALANFDVLTEPGYENETYVTPHFTLAALDPNSGMAGLQPKGPAGGMAAPHTETPEIAEEEDDAQPQPLAVPLPRAKPLLDPSLPLPRMRPDIPASGAIPYAGHTIPGAAAGVALPGAGAIPLKPQPKPGTVLALLTPQGDAARPEPAQPDSAPPISVPPNTILTPTPFGIPYVLQTQSVDTACLKPELLDILRQVEKHYGQKVVVTSGYRSRGREGSLHRTCSAADIIVPGVSSQTLAAFARSIPSVGGVGTYCHQSLVHVDIGTPRDWKYGCGSYFAMRDGTAHWGKLPQSTQED